MPPLETVAIPNATAPEVPLWQRLGTAVGVGAVLTLAGCGSAEAPTVESTPPAAAVPEEADTDPTMRVPAGATVLVTRVEDAKDKPMSVYTVGAYAGQLVVVPAAVTTTKRGAASTSPRAGAAPTPSRTAAVPAPSKVPSRTASPKPHGVEVEFRWCADKQCWELEMDGPAFMRATALRTVKPNQSATFVSAATADING